MKNLFNGWYNIRRQFLFGSPLIYYSTKRNLYLVHNIEQNIQISNDSKRTCCKQSEIFIVNRIVSNELLIETYEEDYHTMMIHLLLTHWGRVAQRCVGKLAIIVSDNGLSPKRHQAIIWTSAGILLIGPLGTTFSEMLIEIQIFHSRKCTWNVVCEMASILPRPQYVKHAILLYNRSEFEPSMYSYTKHGLLAWWRYELEMFSALLALCEGKP